MLALCFNFCFCVLARRLIGYTTVERVVLVITEAGWKRCCTDSFFGGGPRGERDTGTKLGISCHDSGNTRTTGGRCSTVTMIFKATKGQEAMN